MAIQVLWPDGPRLVSERRIIQFAHDVLVDEEIDKEVYMNDDDPDIDIPMPDIDEAVEILSDKGLMTFSKLCCTSFME